MTERSSDETVICDLLHRLNSAEAGAAWSEFIDRYASLILKAANQFEYGQDRTGDCFLYLCEKLCEHGFRRLLKFNTGGPARFETWLAAVLFNLCVDWHRREFGRVQLLPAITALPAFDQAVYRLCFEDAMATDACFETLQADFPDLTRKQLSDAIARVHRVLTPRQRWQISVRNLRRARDTDTAGLDHLRHAGPGPDDTAQADRDAEQLHAAMVKLEPDQRLLLHLRFQQGLTLKRIAGIMHLGDVYRARRQVQAALDALTAQLQSNGLSRR